MHGAYGLQFDNNLIVYKHVYTLWMVVILAKHFALVDYGTRHLPYCSFLINSKTPNSESNYENSQ